MPNCIKIKIEFESDEPSTNTIYESICIDGNLDFNALIPRPLHIYQGSLSSDIEKDFGGNTWYAWNKANWGTKWNAFNSEKLHYENGKASIVFETAWSVPYPVIVAFLNKFRLPCILKYYDDCHNFWGVEVYENSGEVISRTSKRYTLAEDRESLCIELNGYYSTAI